MFPCLDLEKQVVAGHEFEREENTCCRLNYNSTSQTCLNWYNPCGHRDASESVPVVCFFKSGEKRGGAGLNISPKKCG